MAVVKKRISPWFRKILFGIILLSLIGIGIVWYIFNQKFSDITKTTTDFTIDAMDLIHEFKNNDSLANKKYTEKIIVVNGTVSETEAADTTINIKMADSTGSFIIFAFQQQHQAEAKKIKQGAHVSIKGSCSGGNYSHILETEFITFKRCALNVSK